MIMHSLVNPRCQVPQRVLEATLLCPYLHACRGERARCSAAIWKLLEKEDDANDKYVDCPGGPDHPTRSALGREAAQVSLMYHRCSLWKRTSEFPRLHTIEKIGDSSETQADQGTQFCECWEATAVEDGSGMCTAGSAGNDAQRAILPPILDKTQRPDTMDGNN